MPHLVVSWDNQLMEKRALAAALVVGRSSECDIVIRDVHLSRRHCKIDACDGGWCVVDMDSKNGLLVNGQRVLRQRLGEGDVLRMGKEGRLRIAFHEAVVPADDQCLTLASPTRFRPADPGDTMDGTVAGFTLLEPGEGAGVRATGNFPSPRPQPRTPAAYERDDVARMISALVSSSWDSIYEQARRKADHHRVMAMADTEPASTGRRHRPEKPVDLSLQVQPEGESEPVAATTTDGPMRLMAAAQVGHPIARQADPVSVAVEPELIEARWIALTALPAAVAVVEHWQTDSSGSMPLDVPPAAESPSPAAAPTRTLPRPQPRSWNDLLLDPRILTGVAAAIGLILIGLSAWHILRHDKTEPVTVLTDAVISKTASGAVDGPRPADNSSPDQTALPPRDVASAAPIATPADVAVPTASVSTDWTSSSQSTSALASLLGTPAMQPVDDRESGPVYFSNDLKLGLPDPFGPMFNAPTQAAKSDATGLDMTASLLDNDIAPAGSP